MSIIFLYYRNVGCGIDDAKIDRDQLENSSFKELN